MLTPKVLAAAILAILPTAQAQWDASRFAYYTSGAGTDYASALPIGNGRVAAVNYGNADERLSLFATCAARLARLRQSH